MGAFGYEFDVNIAFLLAVFSAVFVYCRRIAIYKGIRHGLFDQFLIYHDRMFLIA